MQRLKPLLVTAAVSEQVLKRFLPLKLCVPLSGIEKGPALEEMEVQTREVGARQRKMHPASGSSEPSTE